MAREITVIRGALAPDHIHMLVAAPRRLAPSKIAQYLRGRSSRKLQEEFSSLRKRCWGQHLCDGRHGHGRGDQAVYRGSKVGGRRGQGLPDCGEALTPLQWPFASFTRPSSPRLSVGGG